MTFKSDEQETETFNNKMLTSRKRTTQIAMVAPSNLKQKLNSKHFGIAFFLIITKRLNLNVNAQFFIFIRLPDLFESKPYFFSSFHIRVQLRYELITVI